jgi:hypothetical protein
MVGVTLQTREQSVTSSPIENATPRKATPYLKEEKAHFLFLEAPADVAGAAGAAAAARGASVVDCPAAGAPASALGDGPLATGVGSGDGGAGSHLLGRTCPLSSSSSSSDDEYSSVPGEECPCCSRSRNSSLLRSRRSRRRTFRFLLRSTHSYSRQCAARASARDRGVGGSDRAAFTRTICGDQAKP